MAGGIETNYHDVGDGRQVLLIHGRDDRVIPLANSLTLNRWIDNLQLHVFGRCSHWVQIVRSRSFNQLARNFLAE